MSELFFLGCILVLAAWLSRFTINPRIFNYIKWGLFVSTATLSLIILNSETLAGLFSPGVEFLESQGVGHPESWRIRSKYDGEVVSACYYLAFFSTWLCVLVSAMYEPPKRKKNLSTQDRWMFVAGLFLFGWILHHFFYGDGYSSRHTGRVLNAFYNSQIGLVAHLYITINAFAFAFGVGIRTVLRETNNL